MPAKPFPSSLHVSTLPEDFQKGCAECEARRIDRRMKIHITMMQAQEYARYVRVPMNWVEDAAVALAEGRAVTIIPHPCSSMAAEARRLADQKTLPGPEDSGGNHE
jgi:hypothetical protein